MVAYQIGGGLCLEAGAGSKSLSAHTLAVHTMRHKATGKPLHKAMGGTTAKRSGQPLHSPT